MVESALPLAGLRVLDISSFIAAPAGIEHRLREGAARARAIAIPFLRELRAAAGLRRLG